MSFDGMVTFGAVREFRDKLRAGKIEKIYQPQPEQLLLSIHTKEGNRKLFLSASSNHSAAYLIDRSPENPKVPPTFCMVLRKHLGAGRITDISQHENDRIIEILLETVDEMGFEVNRKLIIELMGKHSNIVLVDMKTGRIIDSIKHISIDVNRARQILPGKAYEYPPAQEKTPFTCIDAASLEEGYPEGAQFSRYILQKVQGISPALAESLAEGGEEGRSERVCRRIKDIIDDVDRGSTSPCVYIDEAKKPVDFHIEPLSVYEGSYGRLDFDTFSEAAAWYFTHRESSNTVKQKANDLMRVINSYLDKLHLKVQKLNEDLYKAENSEKYRLYGELLTANLHAVEQGASSVTVTSYYDGKKVTIPLDPKHSAARNAQGYYKRYGKSKTAIKEKKIQLEEVSEDLRYLESVSEFTSKAASIEVIEELKQELIENGFIRFRKSTKRTTKAKPKPYRYTLSSGSTVLAGRNNKENDWLTLKKASSTDLWFHTKDIPGSHAILFTKGKTPSEEDLFEAASIAAFHSKGRDSENVPVDFTRVKHVKKPSGAKPGMVIFTHNRTLYVKPEVPGKKEP